MKRILSWLLIAAATLTSFAQRPTYQGLLWKISGNGLEKPSFLYGTMHVSNKVAFHLSDSFYKAIESVDVVSLEINPETWMETMTSNDYVADNMGNAFSIRGGNRRDGFYKSLFDLEAPENKEIGGAMGAELGILNSLLYRTSNYSADFQEDTYLDLFIFQAGKKQGKAITGLEQLGVTMRLNELAAKPENDKEIKKANKENAARKRFLLEKILDGKSYGEVMEEAYRQGDLDLLDSMSRLTGQDDKNHELIIVYRNIGMADAMDSIMQKQSLFAGIGAAHLPNSYGVINLLREKGYTVTQVDNEKSDFGKQTKDRLEETFITQKFYKQTLFDGSFSTYMPGPLYEFPEANDIMLAAYPDMANGAKYVITRMSTFAPYHGWSEQQYLDKLDSLFFENIPGKIEEKKEIEIDGVKGYDILNKTKKGDYQRYHIMVKPAEIIIFKASGKKEFIKRPEVAAFFDEIHFYKKTDWHTYSPANTAYEVSLPGTDMYEGENNSFRRGFWKKNVQSNHPELGHFTVLNRSMLDLEYMEEDSFELHHLTHFFAEQFNYEVVESEHTTTDDYAAYQAKATHDTKPPLYTKAVIVGSQYYMLAAQTTSEEAASKFLNSMKFTPFTFTRPFVLRHDTVRLFTVTTSVEVPPEQRSYYNYFRTDDDEDDSHEEEQKTAMYYNKESDETIYTRMYRYHKYFYEEEVDSLWNDYTEDAQQNTFFVRSKKTDVIDSVYTLEIELGDTNSGKNLLVKHFLSGGMVHSLFTENDYRKPRSKFVDEFFSSFTPWDTAVGTPILQNKVDMFLADLVSEDSITREAARRSFDEINFEDEDAPKMIAAYYQNMSGENSLENRRDLADKIGYLKHPSIQPWVTKALKEVGDSVQFQIPLLEALVAQRTKSSSSLFVKELINETPLGLSSTSVGNMFYPFKDSMKLSKEIYPDVLLLSSLAEYREKIYEVLAKSLDSGVAKPRWYKKHLKQLAWEANNEVKRQQAEESSLALDFYKEEDRSTLYWYEDILLSYTKLLLPYFDNSRAKRFFTRAEKLRLPGFKIDLAVAKLRAGVEQPSGIWEELAANENDRIVVYQRLKEIDRLDLFPKQYNHDSLAMSLYAQKARINQYNDSLMFVDKHWVQDGKDSGYLYFFKIKEKDEDDWNYGYLGPIDTTKAEVERYGYEFDDEMRYSKYEDEDLQIRKQVREYEMRHRKRYRVTDEAEFEELKPKRGQYGFGGF
jgi:uncharacterized protein YbaP (TraB family)